MEAVTSFSEIISFWPSVSALSDDLGVPYQTAAAWKQRDSVPAERWPALITAAHKRGLTITLEQLHSLRPSSDRAVS